MGGMSAWRSVSAVAVLTLASAGEVSAACAHGPVTCAACAGPGYGYAYPYAYGYGGLPYAASRPSLLDGYSDAAPLTAVAPGTPLATGQLFGSHIHQYLGRFGGPGRSRAELLDLATRAFFDAARVLPTPAEREVLGRIVDRHLGGTYGVPAEVAAGPNVVRFMVTVEVPPGSKLLGVQPILAPSAAVGEPSRSSASEDAPPMPPVPPTSVEPEPSEPEATPRPSEVPAGPKPAGPPKPSRFSPEGR